MVRLHGLSTSIVSDRDPVFVSHFRRELFKLLGTQLKLSSAYHLESDGQTKVVNRCLKTYVRCFIADPPKSWALWVHWEEYLFNTTYHASTSTTPFETVYRRKPPVISPWLQRETRVETVEVYWIGMRL